MKFFVEKTNPIGVAQVGLLDEKVTALKAQWNEKYPEKKPSWWKIWKTAETHLTAIVSFILSSVDDLILALFKFEEMSGADKKATVLAASATLYDYIARETLPIWLQPFAKQIRYIIIYIMLSYMIDFIVDKYKNGLWRENEKEQPKEEQKTE